MTYVLTTATIDGPEVSYVCPAGHKHTSVYANPANHTEILLVYPDDFDPSCGTKLTPAQFKSKVTEWLAAYPVVPSVVTADVPVLVNKGR